MIVFRYILMRIKISSVSNSFFQVLEFNLKVSEDVKINPKIRHANLQKLGGVKVYLCLRNFQIKVDIDQVWTRDAKRDLNPREFSFSFSTFEKINAIGSKLGNKKKNRFMFYVDETCSNWLAYEEGILTKFRNFKFL